MKEEKKEKSKKKKSILKRIITITLSVITALLALFIAYLTYCNVSGKVAFVGDYCVVKIVSPSMTPTIPQDMYIFAEKVSPDEVETGDVILFRSRDAAIYGRTNTHRVIECREDGSFITKGDYNPKEDESPVQPEDVLGKYVKNLPWLATIAAWFSKPAVFLIFIIIPALLLVFLSIRDLVRKSKEVKVDLLVAEEVKRLQREGLTKASEADTPEIPKRTVPSEEDADTEENKKPEENEKELSDDVQETGPETKD